MDVEDAAALREYQLKSAVAVVTRAGGRHRYGDRGQTLRVGRVTLLDLPQAKPILEKRIGDSGADGAAVACHVTDASPVAEAAERVRQAFGPCDLLVNNAGILTPHAPLANVALEA